MNEPLPVGFSMTGLHCGIKAEAGREDLTLIVSDRDATAAGVYTQNRVVAAPVLWNRQRTPMNDARLVVINSGNANACTGDAGMADCKAMAGMAAEACGAGVGQALVLSTGIIGHRLPMQQIESGIRAAAGQLGSDPRKLELAARGMMTTDTVPKVAQRAIEFGSAQVRLTGMAKGAAMIGPNMATMLAVLLTDAQIDPPTAQRCLREAVDASFNCISVEGHTSTNDTVLLLANGAVAAADRSPGDLDKFQQALQDSCIELARAIPADGEGAEHLITIDVRGCSSRAAARTIARTIADSPLVKTAIAGADPNWGRIVSAAGYSGVEFAPAGLSLTLNGTRLYDHGAPVAFDAAAVSASMRDARDVSIELELSEGEHAIRFWTTDLTAEYVRLNADYHT